MSRKKDKKRGYKITSELLERKLRNLAEIGVPEGLEARLMASIPEGRQKVVRVYPVGWLRRFRSVGVATAAAVLLFGLMSIIDYAFSFPAKTPLIKFEETSICYIAYDYNSFLSDQNNPSY